MAMLPIIEARIQQSISRMREEMQTRGTVDILKWWMFMATDVIGELTFGESFCMLDQGKVGWQLHSPYLSSLGVLTIPSEKPVHP